MYSKLLILLAFCLTVMITPAYATPDGHAFGFCEQGNQQVVLGGLSSSTRVQRSYPSCTVTVYVGSSGTLATIYSTATQGALTNPFTATSAGSWQFYADNGYYTVTLSGGGLPAPVTLGLFTVISTNIGGGWTYTPATNYPTNAGSIVPTSLIAGTDNPALIVGGVSSDATLSQGKIIGMNGVTAANATTNSVLTRLQSFGGGGGYGMLAVDKTGSQALVPLRINVGGADVVTIQTNGRVSVGTTTDNGFLMDVRGTFNATGVSTFGGGTLSISAAGNLTKINNVTYSWPASQGAASTTLTNDGAGNLTWVAGGGSGISCPGCTTNLLLKFNGTTAANSTFFDDGTSATIGTLAASDNPASIRFQVQKNYTNDLVSLLRNSNTGTAASANMTVRSGAAANDLTMAVTSSTFTPTNGIPASAGYIHTGADSSGGLYIQTLNAGAAIHFQVGGTTDDCTIGTTGLLTCPTLNVSGATTLNSIAYTWPASQAAGTFLSTNGSGVLSWSAAGGAAGISGSGTTGILAIFTAGTAIGNSILDQTTTVLRNNSTAPKFDWYESDQAADEKRWEIGADAKAFTLASRNDANAAGVEIFNIARGTGTAVTGTTWEVPFTLGINGNTTTQVISSNSDTGGAAKAGFNATADSGNTVFGMTGSGFGFGGGAEPDQGFIITTGASNGFLLNTSTGPIKLRPNVVTAGAATNATLTLTTDSGLELTNSAPAAACGAAGTAKLRNNAGTLQVCNNGSGVWQDLPAGTGTLTGSGTTNLVTKWTSTSIIGNSAIFDNGVSTTVGTNAASDNETTIRFQVQKDLTGDLVSLLRNTNTGNLASSNMTVRSGAAANDMTISVTSATFTTFNGIPAASGYIHTGADSSGGMYIQTLNAGAAIHFQAGGTTDDCNISTSGTMACVAFSGSGAGVTGINANNITAGVLALNQGGTGNTVFPNQQVIFSAGGALTGSGNLLWNGSTLSVTAGLNGFTSDQYRSPGIGMSFIIASGNCATCMFLTTSAYSGVGTTPLRLAVDGGAGTQPVTIGAADSGGAGWRVLRVPN